MTMIKIALADDHIVLRRSLAVMIGMLEGYEVVFEADNGASLIESLTKGKVPDIILLDITMPVMDGMETAKWLKQHYPEIKVLALTMIKNDPVVMQMVKNGVRGYLLKDCEVTELQKALIEVEEHGYYYNEWVTRKMKANQSSSAAIALNSQEIAFLRWSCTELTHKEIAHEMQVSPRTIDGYRDTLFKKLNVNSRVGIAIYAIKHGFVQV